MSRCPCIFCDRWLPFSPRFDVLQTLGFVIRRCNSGGTSLESCCKHSRCKHLLPEPRSLLGSGAVNPTGALSRIVCFLPLLTETMSTALHTP